MKIFLLTMVMLVAVSHIQAQQAGTIIITGTVRTAEDGQVLAGSIIKEAGTNLGAVSDSEGLFRLEVPNEFPKTLVISYIGFLTKEVELIEGSGINSLEILLEPDEIGLGEVEVLSTGFEEIPKERATGSFVQIDRELITRRVSPNLLDRLEDVTSGLVFNRTGTTTDRISIRGRSTIFAETQPLIIIDNFPYDGPLENINPNDVESITVLRDAAAASIWGARSGNGVIVITTKRGRHNQPMQISFNANTNFIDAPNLMATPWMNIGDFVDVERSLFERGVFDAGINNQVTRQAMSPAIETLVAHRDGLITDAERDNRLGRLRSIDSRKQLLENFHRTAVNNQYSLGLTGGTDIYRYSFSVGHDGNLNSEIGNSNNRTTLSSNNNWTLFNKKLDLGISFNYTENNALQNTQIPSLYPYEKLADEQGNPSQVIRDHSLRYVNSFTDSDWLDWRYFPLNEAGIMNNSSFQSDVRLNFSAGYKITDWIRAEVLYQHWKNHGSLRNYRPQESYDARYLINRFTQINPDGSLDRPIPLGGFMDTQSNNAEGRYGRTQLTVNRILTPSFHLNGIAGAEFKDVVTTLSENRFYGYDDHFAISLPVDLATQFRLNPNNSLSSIPSGINHDGIVDRFYSFFSNVSLAYNSRLIFTASARRDASNLFGVATNQRAVPLWSSGLAWILSEEKFYASKFLPYVRLRATYGYNGNVDRTMSAFTTANYMVTGPTAVNPGERYAIVRTPPNRNLRWEKIKTVNLGMDISIKEDLLDLSIEKYYKDGMDLIGDFPVSPTTGFGSIRGNFADTRTRGWDLTLNSRPVKGKLTWDINIFFSRVKEEVTNYGTPSQMVNLLSSIGLSPYPGRPLFSIYSMASGGLDPNNGDPVGILNGEPSTNFVAVRLQTLPEDLIFHGSARPQAFGAFRNTVHFGNFNLSANIAFRLDYYIRRQSVNYTDLYAGRITHSDYSSRWTQPGDEQITSVPSMPETNNTFRQFIYTYSEALVERGDHIRFQDIRAGYRLSKNTSGWLPFKNAELYTYVNNIGILWKKTEYDIDPDFQNIPLPRSIAIGLRVDF